MLQYWVNIKIVIIYFIFANQIYMVMSPLNHFIIFEHFEDICP